MTDIWTPDRRLMALSWKQPFAALMLRGKIETRSWYTTTRGWVLICSSKIPYNLQQIESIAGEEQLDRIVEQMALISIKNQKDPIKGHGMAIAIGKLVDCRLMEKADEDKCFVKFYPGLYCHVYEHVKAIEPFPWKGTQGWKEVAPEIKNKIKFL